jgi:hypothetical protein
MLPVYHCLYSKINKQTYPHSWILREQSSCEFDRVSYGVCGEARLCERAVLPHPVERGQLLWQRCGWDAMRARAPAVGPCCAGRGVIYVWGVRVDEEVCEWVGGCG